MKILIDTNVLISASRSTQGKPYAAFVKATTAPNRAYVCEQTLEELRRVFNRKFPELLPALAKFMIIALPVLEILPVPDDEAEEEKEIRDIKDRPIFRCAAANGIDIILTGDKDFLESGVDKPASMTIAAFLQM
jgi:putative PIN family toxin of toxin-antitoxin system